jgi:hypothetical protein
MRTSCAVHRFDECESYLLTRTCRGAREFASNGVDLPVAIAVGDSKKVWYAAKSASVLVPSLT